MAASGWYLEWKINDTQYLILKNSYHMKDKRDESKQSRLEKETIELEEDLNKDEWKLGFGKKEHPQVPDEK